MTTAGPLSGTRILEVVGVGPLQYAGMVLADLGADVVRIERPGGSLSPLPAEVDVLRRHRQVVELDLKDVDDVQTLLNFAGRAHVLLEGFRPGVVERLGIGPDAALARNPALVYGRLTGWGQDGPLARLGGHDVSYASMAGLLNALAGPGVPPTVPSGPIATFPGGALFMVIGVLAALRSAAATGAGQVVDASVIDGLAHLQSLDLARAQGREDLAHLDPSTPYYNVYETSDGRFVSVAAVEPHFYRNLLVELDLVDLPDRRDRSAWPTIRAAIAAAFRQRTLLEWTERFARRDACVTPVLDLPESTYHPHAVARGMYVAPEGVTQPVATPRFSGTPTAASNQWRAAPATAASVYERWTDASSERETP